MAGWGLNCRGTSEPPYAERHLVDFEIHLVNKGRALTASFRETSHVPHYILVLLMSCLEVRVGCSLRPKVEGKQVVGLPKKVYHSQKVSQKVGKPPSRNKVLVGAGPAWPGLTPLADEGLRPVLQFPARPSCAWDWEEEVTRDTRDGVREHMLTSWVWLTDPRKPQALWSSASL